MSVQFAVVFRRLWVVFLFASCFFCIQSDNSLVLLVSGQTTACSRPALPQSPSNYAIPQQCNSTQISSNPLFSSLCYSPCSAGFHFIAYPAVCNPTTQMSDPDTLPTSTGRCAGLQCQIDKQQDTVCVQDSSQFTSFQVCPSGSEYAVGCYLSSQATTLLPANTLLDDNHHALILMNSSITCPSGWSSASGCSLCPPGRYSISAPNTKTSCQDCPAGTANPNYNATSCSACQSFYTSSAGAQICTFGCIPPNTYRNGRTCLNCPSGKFASNSNVTGCGICSAGQGYPLVSTYVDANDAYPTYSCTDCAADTYSNGTACLACPVGKFTNSKTEASLADCVPCSAGKYYSMVDLACDDCAVNTYSNAPGASVCSSCPAGTFTFGTGATNCSQCLVGQYANSNTAGCTSCGENTYSNQTGATACTSCAPGSSTRGATGAQNCSLCDIGEYGVGGGFDCILCGQDTYSSAKGSSVCTACTPGTSTTLDPNLLNLGGLGASNASSCIACPAGKYQFQNGLGCSDCAISTYNPYSAQTSCLSCPGGTDTRFVSGATSLTACLPCRPGTARKQDALWGCSMCTGSTIAPYSGMTDCIYCPIGSGKYANDTGQSMRCPCDPGYGIADNRDLSTVDVTNPQCQQCPAGSQGINTFDYYHCFQCTPGRYAPQAQMEFCTECETLRFNNQTGAVACQECDLFSIVNRDHTVCAACGGDQAASEDGFSCEGISSEESAAAISNIQRAALPSVIFVTMLIVALFSFYSEGCSAAFRKPYRFLGLLIGVGFMAYSIVTLYLFVLWNVDRVTQFAARYKTAGKSFSSYRDACITFLVFSTILALWKLVFSIKNTFDRKSRNSNKEDNMAKLKYVAIPVFFFQDLPFFVFQMIYIQYQFAWTGALITALISTTFGMLATLYLIYSAYSSKDGDPDPDEMGLGPYIEVTIQNVLNKIKNCCCKKKKDSAKVQPQGTGGDPQMTQPRDTKAQQTNTTNFSMLPPPMQAPLQMQPQQQPQWLPPPMPQPMQPSMPPMSYPMQTYHYPPQNQVMYHMPHQPVYYMPR